MKLVKKESESSQSQRPTEIHTAATTETGTMAERIRESRVLKTWKQIEAIRAKDGLHPEEVEGLAVASPPGDGLFFRFR